MPTYEYECKSCRHSFEVFQSMKDEPLKICPECGKEIRRLITGGSGVIFKGSGFYITDAQTNPAADGAKDAAKNDVANGATTDKAGAVGGDKSSASSGTQKRKPVADGGDASGAVEKKEAS
ncbi:MAG: zinc ribbon domain-containing protein [Treponema sp.]|jgi:putative FmdB family regulatory protein|nr:zinc ribbon domain-containing protein [Treponema sp.]